MGLLAYFGNCSLRPTIFAGEMARPLRFGEAGISGFYSLPVYNTFLGLVVFFVEYFAMDEGWVEEIY